MIYVTKTYLPHLSEYQAYLQRIWESNTLTNGGPLCLELEARLKTRLGVRNLAAVSNGTLALQIAIRALKLKGEIITTPFSYVATTSAILWEACEPVFVDVDPISLCIDPNKIEQAINPRTVAILPVHVYGTPCDVFAIDRIARKHKLKVIYDGAHAFGVKINDQALTDFGDITTYSFHATKLFHTAEGGAICSANDEIHQQVELLRSFGHRGDEHICLGINAKMSELNAAMGLSMLPHLDDILAHRKACFQWYEEGLRGLDLQRPHSDLQFSSNYSYFPVIISREKLLKYCLKQLAQIEVFPRRYFYPSLNTLPYLEAKYRRDDCPISEDIAKRILCLPLSAELSRAQVLAICESLKMSLLRKDSVLDESL